MDRDEMTVRLIVELLTPEAGDGDRFLRSVVLSMEKKTSASTNDGEGKKEKKGNVQIDVDIATFDCLSEFGG